MAANGISSLATKQARQEAKLALAASNRAKDPVRYAANKVDISKLPSKYVGNVSIDNPNPAGLVQTRPWI